MQWWHDKTIKKKEIELGPINNDCAGKTSGTKFPVCQIEKRGCLLFHCLSIEQKKNKVNTGRLHFCYPTFNMIVLITKI